MARPLLPALHATSALLVAAALVACGDDTSSGAGGAGGAGGSDPTTTSDTTSTSTGDGGAGQGGSGEGGAGGGGTGPGTIYDVASSLPDYSILIEAVDKAGLAGALQDESASLTVFAPDNDAFAALLEAIGAESLDDLSAEQLQPILLYHVLGAAVDSTAALEAATNGDKVTALGGSVQLGLEGESIELDDRAIVEVADVPASNGIIHGIDGVILPSIADVATTTSAFSSLTAALVAADGDESDPQFVAALDDDTAGPFTVFAPTDDAFGGLVEALSAGNTGIGGLGDFAPYQLVPVLAYHVVVGAAVPSGAVTAGPISTAGGTVEAATDGGVTIDGANVVIADILTSNGIIHVVDGVLVPSITDMVTTAPELDSLLAAVLAADGADGTTPKVAAALDAPAADGAYTLFAPSNDAFLALGAAPSGQDLTNVLLYHVLNEATPIYAADALALAQATELATLLAGQDLVVDTDGSSVLLDDAGSVTDGVVIRANYFTSNGVIHIADKVLLPAD